MLEYINNLSISISQRAIRQMNTTNMGRPRKLTIKAVQQASVDRRNGMTWKALSLKYECAINTIRYSLAEYSDEFAPTVSMLRPQVEQMSKGKNIQSPQQQRYSQMTVSTQLLTLTRLWSIKRKPSLAIKERGFMAL